jgi:Flp pilus assembly protein TadD
MISLLSVFVTERYRLAVVPGLLLSAAAGGVYFWEMCAGSEYRRASIYLVLVAVATWLISIPKHDASLWALDSYNAGWQALESNDLATAERKLNLAYAYVPENAETNFALGNLNLLRNEHSAAKAYYLATLHLDPNHEGAYNNLGILALQEKRWELAARFFTKAVEQDSREAKTYYLLAEAYFNANNFHSAREALSEAIKLKPHQPEFIALREQIRQAGGELFP